MKDEYSQFTLSSHGLSKVETEPLMCSCKIRTRQIRTELPSRVDLSTLR